MARHLVISSQVAHGHVGLSAIVPALQALGHEVIALPTVLLSNHPGHAKVAGQRVDPAVLGQMIDALEANGWLGEINVILSGYLPSIEHVAFVAATVERLLSANPDCRYICDPVLGDDPKGLYIEANAAAGIRDLLIPLADIAMPNRFELAWLADMAVTTPAEAVIAARALAARTVIATSIPAAAGALLTIEIDAWHTRSFAVARRDLVPNGTGDLLAGLIAAGWPLGRAVAAVDSAIAASAGHDELQLAASTGAWSTAPSIPETMLDAT